MYDVVIVEDEELERQALRTILTDNIDGLRIIGEARTGTEAVDLIDRCDIDLMLVDINIPKMNGLDVIRHLRGKHADTKVIITTAYDYFEITRAAIHLKADEYLLKPIRSQVLVGTVQACIQQLGSGRRCRELMRRLDELLDQDGYRDAIVLIRGHVEWIYTQNHRAPGELASEFGAALVSVAREKGLRAADTMAQQASRLRAMSLEQDNRLGVQNLLLGMADLLFDGAGEQSGVGAAGQTPDIVQKALNYIERNLNKGVTLEEVAGCADVSACYLSRLFKKTLGINFVTYLTNRRMDLAKKILMGTDQPVTQISLDLSFNDVSYFCKTFKKEVGVSPSEFRRQFRN